MIFRPILVLTAGLDPLPDLDRQVRVKRAEELNIFSK